MLKFSAWLAIVTGIILAVTVTAIYWGEAVIWPFLLLGYLAAACFLANGLRALRGARHGPFLLAVTWGFAAGMGWMTGMYGFWEIAHRELSIHRS